MEEQQQDELRIGEIFSIIWKHVVWILVISLFAAVACGIFVKYSVSPSQQTYQLSFTVAYPHQYALDKDGLKTDKMQYPDGTSFSVNSIVSADRLNAAKKSDEAFESFDTEKMLNKGKITIVANNNKYSLTISAGYFKDKEQATKFLKAVCEETRKEIIQRATDKDCLPKIEISANASDEKKLEILEKRHNDILGIYEKYREDFRGFTHDEKTLDGCYYKTISDGYETKETIDEQTDTLNEIIVALYESNTSFNFEQSSALITGGANVLVYAILMFIVAFVVASFLFCAVEISRKRKGAAAKEGVGERELHEAPLPEEAEEEPKTEEAQETEEAPEEVKTEEENAEAAGEQSAEMPEEKPKSKKKKTEQE